MTVMRGTSAPKHSTVSQRGRAQTDARLMTRAAIASVCVSAVLIAAKSAAFLLSGSVAMLASLVDSAIDFLASAGNLIAVRQSLVPADQQHMTKLNAELALLPGWKSAAEISKGNAVPAGKGK